MKNSNAAKRENSKVAPQQQVDLLKEVERFSDPAAFLLPSHKSVPVPITLHAQHSFTHHHAEGHHGVAQDQAHHKTNTGSVLNKRPYVTFDELPTRTSKSEQSLKTQASEPFPMRSGPSQSSFSHRSIAQSLRQDSVLPQRSEISLQPRASEPFPAIVGRSDSFTARRPRSLAQSLREQSGGANQQASVIPSAQRPSASPERRRGGFHAARTVFDEPEILGVGPGGLSFEPLAASRSHSRSSMATHFLQTSRLTQPRARHTAESVTAGTAPAHAKTADASTTTTHAAPVRAKSLEHLPSVISASEPHKQQQPAASGSSFLLSAFQRPQK